MANEMRDRLVELMVEADAYDGYECKLCTDDHSCFRCYFTKLADHLIKNGVVVPPCKVGDTVYCLETIGNEINDFVVQNVGITATQGGWGIERGFDAFGKTVFLAKDQAEQKLKEMRGENGNL